MSSSWVEIDAEALRHNARFFLDALGRENACFVLKSNAYGHGLAEVWQTLSSLNPSFIGVNLLEEALKLRSLGFKGTLIVLACLSEEKALKEAFQAQIEHFLTNDESLERWLASSAKSRVHLKFNTGLNRQGFALDQAAAIAERLKAHRSLVVGLCTHFANVEDVSNNTFALRQLSGFQQVQQIFAQHGYQLRSHSASSAAALVLPESRLDFSRIGIALYGLWPSELTRLSYFALAKGSADVLKPVLSWKAPITNIHSINPGEFVGYGCTFMATHPMEIALLPVGYFEGYPRLAGDQKGSYVLIKGQRCPLLGRISMNMMVVDISGTKGLKVGDSATLIGRDGGEQIRADDLARWAQTINYEIVARLNPALPRIIK